MARGEPGCWVSSWWLKSVPLESREGPFSIKTAYSEYSIQKRKWSLIFTITLKLQRFLA